MVTVRWTFHGIGSTKSSDNFRSWNILMVLLWKRFANVADPLHLRLHECLVSFSLFWLFYLCFLFGSVSNVFFYIHLSKATSRGKKTRTHTARERKRTLERETRKESERVREIGLQQTIKSVSCSNGFCRTTKSWPLPWKAYCDVMRCDICAWIRLLRINHTEPLIHRQPNERFKQEKAISFGLPHTLRLVHRTIRLFVFSSRSRSRYWICISAHFTALILFHHFTFYNLHK